MIRPFYVSKNRLIDLCVLLECVDKYSNLDFYYTKNNIRYYINNLKSLNDFLKNSIISYVSENKGEYTGSISVIKSLGANKQRYYIKLVAKDLKVAKDLISILIWNFRKDLYIKIRKDNKFLSALKLKGFRFRAGRGNQVLLYRKFVVPKIMKEEKEEE